MSGAAPEMDVPWFARVSTGLDTGGYSLTQCAQTCDHGSRCGLPIDHDPPDRHETEHGCICYGTQKVSP